MDNLDTSNSTASSNRVKRDFKYSEKRELSQMLLNSAVVTSILI
jgi:hypothetical protein